MTEDTFIPDTEDNTESFRRMRTRLKVLYERVFDDRLQPRTVLIVPSMTLDQEVLAKVAGVNHYEERFLCLLLLLRLPRTRVIYVTSEPIAESIIDYYLHLLPGIPHEHARNRLTLLSCHDRSNVALSQKILDRPRLMERIGSALGDRSTAHMTCFNVTALERRLASHLDVPIYGCDPDLLHLGSKSGGRKLFKQAGLPVAEGFENLADENDVVQALVDLRRLVPKADKAVIKLNEGFSGEGNAVFSFADADAEAGALSREWVNGRLPGLDFVARGMTWDLYRSKIGEMGCIVETYIDGPDKRFPSVQYRINPSDGLEPVSTHDQILGGGDGQVFHGCRFPADEAYRMEIQNGGMGLAGLLREHGVLGRFGIDFISVRDGKGWLHYASEINLRKGGTTHPFDMLQFLTDGTYDTASGQFLTAGGQPRYYYATDNLESERYRGLTPDDLIDIAVKHEIHFHSATQRGVVFHLIGALSQFGKLGTVCVGGSHEEAKRLFHETVAILDRECGC